MRYARILTLIAYASTAGAGCGACGKTSDEASPAPSSAASAPTSSATPGASISESAEHSFDAGPIGDLTFVEMPDEANVPDAGVHGAIGLRHFNVAALYFENGPSSWRLHILDTPLDPASHFIPPGAQAIHVDLPVLELPKTGRVWKKTMAMGDGYFQIALPHGEVNPRGVRQTMSWSSENAYFIALDSWDAKKKWDAKGPQVQDIGLASGRVYIAYKAGHGRTRSAAIAGTFKDAPIRFVGRPFWIPAPAGSQDSGN